MKITNNIAVFDNDKYVLAILKGYCYANNIAMTEFPFNSDGINEVEQLKPVLILVPLDWVSSANKRIEAALLRRTGASNKIKICALVKNSTDIPSVELLEWIDVIINNPFDIGQIDCYLKKNFFLNSWLVEERRSGERRIPNERRHIEFNSDDINRYKEKRNSGYQHGARNSKFNDFQINQRNKCVLIKGHKIELTPKEFKLVELLFSDVDRIFMNDEIINHLWPENNRATKSDLYQYMHLLRKKIEQDHNNPQWIITVKGFGYKLNIGNSEEMYQQDSYSGFRKPDDSLLCFA